MLESLYGNHFVGQELGKSWLVVFYFHLHKDGVISLDYVRITLF